MSLVLNRLYRDEVRRGSTPGIEWWVTEVSGQCDQNVARAQAALKGSSSLPPDPAWQREAQRFVREYSAEQRRLAVLYRRTPSEIGLRPGETAGWNLADRRLALTFDDGPKPGLTQRILKILRASKVPAVFFVMGRNLRTAREGRRLPDYTGFPVGSHSFTHPFLPELSPSALKAELSDTNAEIVNANLAPPTMFRAPYGARGPRELGAVEKLGMRSVLWNIDSQDWQASMQRRPSRIASRTVALALLRRHGIILMHDVQPQTPHELEVILGALGKAGYQFTAP